MPYNLPTTSSFLAIYLLTRHVTHTAVANWPRNIAPRVLLNCVFTSLSIDLRSQRRPQTALSLASRGKLRRHPGCGVEHVLSGEMPRIGRGHTRSISYLLI